MRNVSACCDINYEEFSQNEDKKDSQLLTLEGPAVGKVIHGMAASFGVAEGPATILPDPDNLGAIARIPEGALLVCRTAPPDIAMIIPRIKALVAESGGMLAVTSQFARDCGVPAVMGAKGVPGMIKDGDIIRVDGSKGTVEIIEAEVRNNALII